MKDIGLVNRSVLILLPIFGCMASLVSGYFIVYFTMLDDYIRKYHNYNSQQADFYFTIMTTALPVGAFLGAFYYNRLVEKEGENMAMKMMDVLAIIAALMQVISIYFPVVIVSRLLMGIYCAITTGLIPSWILSMSPSFTSGIFGTFNQIAIALGMAIAYCMGQFLQDHPLGESIKVRIYIGLPIFTSIVHFIGLKNFGFDNVERMIARRDHNEVIRFMKIVYGRKWKQFQKEVRNFKMLPIEVPSIKEAEEAQEESKVQDPKKDSQAQAQKKSLIKNDWEKMKKKMAKIKTKCNNCQTSMIGVMLAVANQASGIVAISEYAKQLFENVQESGAEANTILLIFGFLQVVVTLVSGFFINRFGRRPIMMIGQTIIVISLLACSLVTMMVNKHQIITTALLLIYVVGYSISIGPLFMMYAVQTLSNLQLVIQVYWGLMILLTLTTDILIEEISLPVMFTIFFICSLLSLFFFYKKMIETKDVPKKEIKALLQKNEFIWESSEYIFSQTVKNDTHAQKSLGTI